MKPVYSSSMQTWLTQLSDLELAFVYTCRRKEFGSEQQQFITREAACRKLTASHLEALVEGTMGKKFTEGCLNCGSGQTQERGRCRVCGHREKERGLLLAGLGNVAEFLEIVLSAVFW